MREGEDLEKGRNKPVKWGKGWAGRNSDNMRGDPKNLELSSGGWAPVVHASPTR